MKQKIFYESTFGRSNAIKTFILSFFFSITSHPRLSIEVFIRKNFGTGYMSLASAITVIVILGIWPYAIYHILSYEGIGEFILHFTTWYLYLILFGYKSWKHYLDIRMEPGEFDFTKFSKYGGDKHPGFFEVKLFGKTPTPRFIATILEPGLFLIIGFVLMIFKQPIGFVITINAIIYSLGYFGAYHLGDNYLQEIIDNLILTEELKDICMNGKYPRSDKGFELFDMPVNPDYRRKMADFVTGKDEPLEAY